METWVIITLVIFGLLVLTGIGVGLYFAFRGKSVGSGNGGGSGSGRSAGGGGIKQPPVIPPSKQGGPTYFAYQGNMDGTNESAAYQNIASLEACTVICNSTTGCNMLTYDPNGKVCYIYNTQKGATPKMKNIIYDPTRKISFTWSGSTIHGNDVINGSNMSSEDQCLATCNQVFANEQSNGGYYMGEFTNYGPTFITQMGIKSDNTVDCWCKSAYLSDYGGPNWLSWTTAIKAVNL